MREYHLTIPHSLLVPPTRNLAMACGPSWMLTPLDLFRLGRILGGALSESSEELRSSKCPVNQVDSQLETLKPVGFSFGYTGQRPPGLALGVRESIRLTILV